MGLEAQTMWAFFSPSVSKNVNSGASGEQETLEQLDAWLIQLIVCQQVPMWDHMFDTLLH